MRAEIATTRYVMGRKRAVVVSRFGALVILLAAPLIVASIAKNYPGNAQTLLSIGIGLLLILFGQVATAVFDMADHVLGNRAPGNAFSNAERDSASAGKG
jgi:hypothetical protein